VSFREFEEFYHEGLRKKCSIKSLLIKAERTLKKCCIYVISIVQTLIVDELRASNAATLFRLFKSMIDWDTGTRR
jgi:hypothetical protein